MTPQAYLAILQEIMKKDIALAKFYNQYKDSDPASKAKLQICMTRYKIVKEELAEL